jgi:hypothetical protein
VISPATHGNAARASTQLDALDAINSDPSALAALSDPGALLMGALKSTAEEAGNAALSVLKSEANTVLLPMLADAMGSTVADIASEIPLVGQVIAMAVKVITMLFDASSYNEAQAQARCRELQQKFVPVGTGSVLGEGDVVPADIFAPVHRIYDTWDPGTQQEYEKKRTSRPDRQGQYYGFDWLNPMTSGFCVGVEWYACTLGQALTLLLEGAPCDSADVNWEHLADAGGWPTGGWYAGAGVWSKIHAGKPPHYPASAAEFDAATDRNILYWNEQWRASFPTKHRLGPSQARRRQFRKLRRAIRACHLPGLERGARSDGGVGLWTLYLDLLRAEINAGNFPPQYACNALYFRQLLWQPIAGPDMLGSLFGGSGDWSTLDQGNQTCAAAAFAQILGIADQWGRAIDPRYTAGQQKVAGMKAQALVIAKARAAEVRAKLPSPAASPAASDTSTSATPSSAKATAATTTTASTTSAAPIPATSTTATPTSAAPTPAKTTVATASATPTTPAPPTPITPTPALPTPATASATPTTPAPPTPVTPTPAPPTPATASATPATPSSVTPTPVTPTLATPTPATPTPATPTPATPTPATPTAATPATPPGTTLTSDASTAGVEPADSGPWPMVAWSAGALFTLWLLYQLLGRRGDNDEWKPGI